MDMHKGSLHSMFTFPVPPVQRNKHCRQDCAQTCFTEPQSKNTVCSHSWNIRITARLRFAPTSRTRITARLQYRTSNIQFIDLFTKWLTMEDLEVLVPPKFMILRRASFLTRANSHIYRKSYNLSNF